MRRDAQCRTWFGDGVVAAACSPRRLRTALAHSAVHGGGRMALGLPATTARAGRRRSSHGAAPGVTQAIAAPLRPGGRITLRGPVPRGTELWVRGAARGELVEARFRLGARLSQGGTVRAALDHHRLRLVLRTPRGQEILPDRVNVTERWLRNGPTAVRLHVAGRHVHLAAIVPTSRLLIGFAAHRRGRLLDAHIAEAKPHRERRVTLPPPRRARFIVIAAASANGSSRSRPSYVRLQRAQP